MQAVSVLERLVHVSYQTKEKIMGTEEKTPAEEAGLVVGGIYIGEYGDWLEVLMLEEDDGTINPYFYRHTSEGVKVTACASVNKIVGCFSDPFNPTENEVFLLALSLGLELEELKIKIEQAKKISKEVLEKIGKMI